MDNFSAYADSPTSPARSAVTVIAGTDLALTSKALYIGSGGDLTVVMADGAPVTFKSVPSGLILPIRVLRVTTASTATNIVALA